MKVLSLFDGISCARVSLNRANIPVDEYIASEIEKNAILISTKNFPDIKQVGSVVGLSIPHVDLLIGGSPCTDLSIAKKDREGLAGSRSSLFWEYVRIKEESKPKWFILENVASMSKSDKDTITEALQVEPILFNASLVSAQCRKRLFWTNIPFTLPADKGILLQDILQPLAEVDKRMMTQEGKAFCLDACYYKGSSVEHTIQRKMRTLVKENEYRKLTPVECERLQGLPDDYTKGVANTNRYKCLGNAFNVDVVAHILSQIAIV
jgi:DNA (cytosine-5)-methyltransferase 3A